MLRFEVRGRRGDRYKVAAWRDGAELLMTCSCPAGVNRRHCHHRVALLNGDIDALISENAEDVSRLKELVAGTRLEAVISRLGEIERLYGTDNMAFEALTGELAELLAAGFDRQPALAEHRRQRRTARIDIVFEGDNAKGWAFDVAPAHRPALDITFSQLVDRERTQLARLTNPNAKSLYRWVWTQGVPPALTFERGHIFYDPAGVRQMPWAEALKVLRRAVQVLDATPDRVSGPEGWVEFELRRYEQGKIVDRCTRRCSQQAFAEFLRTGQMA